MPVTGQDIGRALRTSALVIKAEFDAVAKLATTPEEKRNLLQFLNQQVNYLINGSQEVIDDSSLVRVVPEHQDPQTPPPSPNTTQVPE